MGIAFMIMKVVRLVQKMQVKNKYIFIYIFGSLLWIP